MIKALVIVPYEGLYEMMKEIQLEVKDFQFDIELGNLYEGVAVAKEAENNGYHVIISRGGTASLIQEAVSIPVIDIQVTGYDVLRIITLVKGFSRKSAIVGFSNITQGAATICKILDLDIKTLTISKDTEVKEILTNLKKRGYEVIIGDVVTVQAAKQLGLTGVLITSGKEAIMEALEEAKRSHRIFSQLQQDVSLFQSILDGNEQPIGVFNREEKLVYGNERFNREFHWMIVENSNDIKKLIQETALMKEKQTRAIQINQSFWNITACPQNGAIALFFEKNIPNQAAVQDGERKTKNAIEFHTSATYVLFSGKSEPIQTVLKQIDQYCTNDETVWISGEKGNGKELAAHTIFVKRNNAYAPFIVLHGDILRPEQLKDFMNDFFEKYAHGVIYLKNIDQLSEDMQKDLYHFVKNGHHTKVKWLVSSESNMEEKVKTGTFDRDLYYTLGQQKIYIPPLRERREDIEDLVHVFISDLHPKYGNAVVGIRTDALDELACYDWPGNVEQLKQVIEQLFKQTSSYYIEKEDVAAVLAKCDQPEKKDEALTPIDLSGTLEEIEKQVITKVLEEEGLNQSKAAKRLGINRSTLWRKLK